MIKYGLWLTLVSRFVLQHELQSNTSNSDLSYGCNLWCRTKQKEILEGTHDNIAFPLRLWMEKVLCH